MNRSPSSPDCVWTRPLYAPAPPRQPGQNGRPPLKGPRRPPLKTLLDQPQVTWASAAVAWYDGTTRTVELTSQTAVWYRSGKPPVLICWVLVRDPQGAFAPQALLCTDPAADPTQILEWFVLRWQLEVTFQEVRTHLNQSQGETRIWRRFSGGARPSYKHRRKTFTGSARLIFIAPQM